MLLSYHSHFTFFLIALFRNSTDSLEQESKNAMMMRYRTTRDKSKMYAMSLAGENHDLIKLVAEISLMWPW